MTFFPGQLSIANNLHAVVGTGPVQSPGTAVKMSEAVISTEKEHSSGDGSWNKTRSRTACHCTDFSGNFVSSCRGAMGKTGQERNGFVPKLWALPLWKG
jgi:hypothetical protein